MLTYCPIAQIISAECYFPALNAIRKTEENKSELKLKTAQTQLTL